MPVSVLLVKVRTLPEWADQVLSKMKGYWMTECLDIPQTVMTTRAPTVLTKNIFLADNPTTKK